MFAVFRRSKHLIAQEKKVDSQNHAQMFLQYIWANYRGPPRRTCGYELQNRPESLKVYPEVPKPTSTCLKNALWSTAGRSRGAGACCPCLGPIHL